MVGGLMRPQGVWSVEFPALWVNDALMTQDESCSHVLVCSGVHKTADAGSDGGVMLGDYLDWFAHVA